MLDMWTTYCRSPHANPVGGRALLIDGSRLPITERTLRTTLRAPVTGLIHLAAVTALRLIVRGGSVLLKRGEAQDPIHKDPSQYRPDHAYTAGLPKAQSTQPAIPVVQCTIGACSLLTSPPLPLPQPG